MANLLCIETSTTVCSVAIGNEQGLLGSKEVNEGYVHAENLHLFIDEVLKQAQLNRNEIDGVAVGKGPGSYTGLRIGVSAAKGIAYALNIPLISMNTLLNLCNGIKKQTIDKNAILCPMLDARRMEVYTALYDFNLTEIKPTHALIVTEESLVELSKNNKLILFGDGATKCADLIKENSGIEIILNQMPSAINMLAHCLVQYKSNIVEDTAYFEPFYLKEFFTGSN